jgi:hypothetical protein
MTHKASLWMNRADQYDGMPHSCSGLLGADAVTNP